VRGTQAESSHWCPVTFQPSIAAPVPKAINIIGHQMSVKFLNISVQIKQQTAQPCLVCVAQMEILARTWAKLATDWARTKPDFLVIYTFLIMQTEFLRFLIGDSFIQRGNTDMMWPSAATSGLIRSVMANVIDEKLCIPDDATNWLFTATVMYD